MLGSTGPALLLAGTLLLASGCTKDHESGVGTGGRASTDGRGVGGQLARGASSRAPRVDPPRPKPSACFGITSACSLLTEFPARAGAWWGDGDDLHGGLTLLGAGLTRAPNPSALHLTGTVAGDGVGFAIWFDHCTDLSNYLGLRFLLRGALKGAPSRRIQVAVQTNGDLAEQTSPPTGLGACTPAKPESAAAECVAPSVSVALTKAPARIHWGDIAGGKPQVWDPKVGPREVTGVAFTFPWDAQAKPYSINVTFDDFGFISAVALPCSVLPLPAASP